MDRIEQLENEIGDLRDLLYKKEAELLMLKQKSKLEMNLEIENPVTHRMQILKTRLPKWAIMRYSRQILMPEIGVKGQIKLCNAKVLVVGAGGLGCPAAMYLAGAGVGQIGILDYDTVDITNIHRQVLHREKDETMSKVESAAKKLRSINSRIQVVPYDVQINTNNADDIVSGYQLVLDCTDNVPTRYLLNDVCIMAKIPLISGAALKMDGQLTIYGYRTEYGVNDQYAYVGPCYRCVFPKPPPPDAVGTCSSDGVAGPVPGVIGTLQALEAIKYLTDTSREKLLVGRMLLFDGEDLTFRVMNLRPRSPRCEVCSENRSITALVDYETYCKMPAKDKAVKLELLPDLHRITASSLHRQLYGPLKSHMAGRPLLFDVRSEAEFKMCHIENSINTPKDKFGDLQMEKFIELIENTEVNIVFICRRGNDSQIVVKKLMDAVEQEHKGKLFDVIGGLHAWSTEVDDAFPVY